MSATTCWPVINSRRSSCPNETLTLFAHEHNGRNEQDVEEYVSQNTITARYEAEWVWSSTRLHSPRQQHQLTHCWRGKHDRVAHEIADNNTRAHTNTETNTPQTEVRSWAAATTKAYNSASARQWNSYLRNYIIMTGEVRCASLTAPYLRAAEISLKQHTHCRNSNTCPGNTRLRVTSLQVAAIAGFAAPDYVSKTRRVPTLTFSQLTGAWSARRKQDKIGNNLHKSGAQGTQRTRCRQQGGPLGERLNALTANYKGRENDIWVSGLYDEMLWLVEAVDLENHQPFVQRIGWAHRKKLDDNVSHLTMRKKYCRHLAS